MYALAWITLAFVLRIFPNRLDVFLQTSESFFLRNTGIRYAVEVIA